jgi:16S rRNA (cytosine967-C5)-methyltransferase
LRAPLAEEFGAAAQAVGQVLAGRALPQALAALAREHRLEGVSRAAVADMAHGAMRRLGTAQALAQRLNARPPAPEVAALQLLGLSELLAPARRHEAVVVDQLVSAARLRPALAPAAPFLNATMRRFLREREALLAALADDPQARWNHPAWWVEQVRRDHPRHWESVLAAADARPPMTLRVNRRRGSAADYLARLTAAGMAGVPIGPDAVLLAQPCEVTELPGFAQGDVSVQDLAAQIAAAVLDPQPGERVLDACAAPGGKSAHLLELADCQLLAIDTDATRLQRVHENLQRLSLQAEVRQGDASRPADWWDGRPFQRILLDAPCSASGIVRRHPDIRWLRRRRDLATLAERQSQMLDALWGLLEPGGTLLFATCSVFRAEGERVVERFRAGRPDAQQQPLFWRWQGHTAPHRLSQLLPHVAPDRNHDGFFYASFRKRQ